MYMCSYIYIIFLSILVVLLYVHFGQSNHSMTEDVDKHVLRKYEVQQKLGKGVVPHNARGCRHPGVSVPQHRLLQERMALSGRHMIKKQRMLWRSRRSSMPFKTPQMRR